MSELHASWWQHQVSVERYAGSGSRGDTYQASQTEASFVLDGTRLVVNPDGETVTSTATVYLPPTVAPVPPGSKVTLPAKFAGRTGQVITTVVRLADGGFPEHQVLHLQ